MSSNHPHERTVSSRVAVAIRHRRAIEPFAVLAFIVLLFSILITLKNVLSIEFLFDRNYNEGWNVYNAERLIHHELVYDDNYWRVNNYPIGSFLVIAGVNRLINDLLLSGRIVALLSFAAIGILAAVAIRRFGGERIDAVFGAGCALGFCYLVAPAWIMVDDPQTLGEAAMMGGLVSYLAEPRGRLRLLRTAFLVVLAGFIKHNLLSVPFAITLDLALRSPRIPVVTSRPARGGAGRIPLLCGGAAYALVMPVPFFLAAANIPWGVLWSDIHEEASVKTKEQDDHGTC